MTDSKDEHALSSIHDTYTVKWLSFTSCILLAVNFHVIFCVVLKANVQQSCYHLMSCAESMTKDTVRTGRWSGENPCSCVN
jgi:hypothetical protein